MSSHNCNSSVLPYVLLLAVFITESMEKWTKNWGQISDSYPNLVPITKLTQLDTNDFKVIDVPYQTHME